MRRAVAVAAILVVTLGALVYQYLRYGDALSEAARVAEYEKRFGVKPPSAKVTPSPGAQFLAASGIILLGGIGATVVALLAIPERPGRGESLQ